MPKEMRKQTIAATDGGARPDAPDAPDALGRFNGPDFEQIAEAGQRSLAAVANLHSRSFRDALRFNAELLEFARRRIGAEMQTSDRLARCRSVSEAMDALGDFYQGAFRDYAEETTALVRLGSEIGSQSAEEIAAETAALRGKKGD